MQAIQELQIKFSIPKTHRLSFHIGSVMQGVLMHSLDQDYAKFLHQNQQPPYRQSVKITDHGRTLIWSVAALNTLACNEIIRPLYELEDSIFLKRKKVNLPIIEKQIVSSTTYEELTEFHLGADDSCSGFSFNFITPTAFKSQGQYVFIPTADFLIQSLYRRWNLLSEELDLSSFIDVHHLTDALRLEKYNLRSNPFSLERHRIPAFMGNIQFSTKSQKPIKNFLCLLAHYGNYSGIGIKTGIGMGYSNITPYYKK